MTITTLGAGKGTLAVASPLLTGLVSYWKLEEASGTRFDAHGTNHLTDNNTVTQATGRVGNAAQFTGSNLEFLSIADNSSLSMGAGARFTLAAWVYLTSKGDTRNIIAKRAGVGDLEYYMRYNLASDRFNLEVSPDGFTPVTSVDANASGSPALNTWYFVVAGYDGSQLLIQVNNGTVNTQPYNSDVYDGGSLFQLGAWSGANELWDGRIDEAGLWKRWLTAGERTQLYNGGAGLTYPFT